MVCRRRLGEHGFYRLNEPTVERGRRMVETVLQVGYGLGMGRALFSVSGRASWA